MGHLRHDLRRHRHLHDRLGLRDRAFHREVVVMTVLPPRNYRYVIARDQATYFDACARVRGISPSALIKRLLDVICRDQMVLSILDDDSKCQVRMGEHAYSKKRAK